MMTLSDGFILATGGLFSGILAGLLGIGGGTVLVPLLMAVGYAYDQSVATSVLAIVMTALSGTIQNYRMGYVKFQKILPLAIPAIVTALWGGKLVATIPDYLLKTGFAILLLINIYLSNLRKQLASQEKETERELKKASLSRIGTGALAGLLAGLFGVGGGVILVPLQMLLLGENIKQAIQTSLGVIVITAISACIGHALEGNVLFLEGILLGMGGLVGAQISTRYLPKFPDRVVRFSFYSLLVILSIYFFWQAWQSYRG